MAWEDEHFKLLAHDWQHTKLSQYQLAAKYTKLVGGQVTASAIAGILTRRGIRPLREKAQAAAAPVAPTPTVAATPKAGFADAGKEQTVVSPTNGKGKRGRRAQASAASTTRPVQEPAQAGPTNPPTVQEKRGRYTGQFNNGSARLPWREPLQLRELTPTTLGYARAICSWADPTTGAKCERPVPEINGRCDRHPLVRR